MDLQFINAEDGGVDVKHLKSFIPKLKKHVSDEEGVLNVIFVNDEYIQSLNKAYRKKDKPTDVLSFSYIESDDQRETGLIGEIYISVDTAKRQAEENEEDLSDEVDKLFVHGFLHIFGYDHAEDADYKKMHKAECEVLGRELPFIEKGE